MTFPTPFFRPFLSQSSLLGLAVGLALAPSTTGCGSSSEPLPVPNGMAAAPGTGGGGGMTPGGTGATTGTPLPDDASLAQAYQDYFTVGVAIEPIHVTSHGELIKQHFNRITAENAMKFGNLATSEGNYNWTGADALADFARENDMPMTGHAMVWHRQAPNWVFSDLIAGEPASIETLKSRMQAHIEAMVERYGDVVDNWDVVNEAISDNGAKTYRDGDEGSDYYRIFQNEDYVYWAFKYTYDALEAQEAGSAAGKLYYNDYNVNLKVDRILTMLAAVEAKGVPVDGVGLQAHVRVDWPSVTELEQTINKIVAAGYKVKISELDVSLYNDYPMGTLEPAPEIEFTEQVEAQQAQRYADLFALYRKHSDDITSVTLWGISDDDTWLDDEPVAGRNNYPLLFDDDDMPKQALSAILDF